MVPAVPASKNTSAISVHKAFGIDFLSIFPRRFIETNADFQPKTSILRRAGPHCKMARFPKDAKPWMCGLWPHILHVLDSAINLSLQTLDSLSLERILDKPKRERRCQWVTRDAGLPCRKQVLAGGTCCMPRWQCDIGREIRASREPMTPHVSVEAGSSASANHEVHG